MQVGYAAVDRKVDAGIGLVQGTGAGRGIPKKVESVVRLTCPKILTDNGDRPHDFGNLVFRDTDEIVGAGHHAIVGIVGIGRVGIKLERPVECGVQREDSRPRVATQGLNFSP